MQSTVYLISNYSFSTKDYKDVNIAGYKKDIVCRNENCTSLTCKLIYHVIFHCVSEYTSPKVFNFILSTFNYDNEVQKGVKIIFKLAQFLQQYSTSRSIQ